MACYREFNPAALSDDSAQNRRDEHTANGSIPQAGVPTPQNIRGRHFGVNNETEHTQCLSHHQRSRNPFSGDVADDEIKLSFVSFEDIVEVAGDLASRTVTHRELQKLS